VTAVCKRAPAQPIQVECSLFAGIRKRVSDVWRGSWEAFVEERLPELVSARVPCPADPTPKQRQHAKKRLPGFVLAPFSGPRSDDTVGAHTALAIDVDRLPGDDLGALLKRAKRYRCAVYETPSSADDAPRVRVVVALDAPLDPEHVIAARLAFAEALGLDPKACGTAGAIAASQVMFAGALEGTRERGLWTYEGESWCPPPAAAAPPRRERTPVSPAPRTRAVPAGAFPFDAPPDLRAIAKAVPPAGHDGDRHLLVRGLGGWLARRGYTPDAIAEAVRTQIPSSDPEERAAQARYAAERVRRDDEAPGWEALREWAERHAKGPSTLRQLERDCRDPREPEGFGGVWSESWAREWPQWEARAERWRAANDTAPRVVTDGAERLALPAGGGELDATGLHLHPATGWPWILQHVDSFWLHRVSEPSYRVRQYRAGELDAAVARHLAGLVSEEDRKPSALRAAWVRPVDKLTASYTARSHTYDDGRLTLAALDWAPLAARHHAHIERWLRALFGAGYAAAAQWLAAVVALDRPAPCLYLPGPRGLGKSLLADGLAALWCRPAPVGMSEAIADFNQSTGECPLIFTDEGFPERMNFQAFRKMITEHSRPVNAKHRSPVVVEGCGRFMIAANNEDVLRYQKTGTLTRDDLDAISDRLLVITCRAEARAVLESHSHEDLARWASADIAEHALWLAEAVALEPSGRMAARPGGGERILASVVAGRSAEVLNRIREAIGTGAMGEKSGVRVPKRAQDEVYVNVTLLHATFDGRVSLAAVAECCDSFALRSGVEQHTLDRENRKCRILSRALLDAAFKALD
jgi:hypothetical protein